MPSFYESQQRDDSTFGVYVEQWEKNEEKSKFFAKISESVCKILYDDSCVQLLLGTRLRQVTQNTL